MKLAKKLACLALAGVIALAQVPVVSFAKTNTKKNTSDFKFTENSITITDKDEWDGYDLSDMLENYTEELEVDFTSSDESVVKADDGLIEVIGNGSSTITAKVDKTSEETEASKSTISVITEYIATMTIKVELPSDQEKDSDSSSSSSSDSGSSSSSDSDSSDSGSSSSSGSGSGSSGGSTQSQSGALVSSNTTTAADGSLVTTTTVSLGGKTMTIVDQVKTLENGAIQRTYQVAGDVSGLTFAGVGTVSADGATLTTPEGQTYPVVSAPMSIIVNPDGTSVGCFIDPATGQAMTFGNSPANAVMQLGADGQMHAHWVDANGFFLTGTVVMNGMMIVFNEEGIMVSYSALAM